MSLLMRTGLIALLFVLSSSVFSAQDSYDFESEAQRQQFLRLTAELRCPMCQNQNIADSDAMIAHDMRRKTYQLIRQGKSEQEVIDYMKARYGDFVHYQPPVTPFTMWLWAFPVMFAIGALLFVVLKRKQPPPEDMAAKLSQAEAMLERDKE